MKIHGEKVSRWSMALQKLTDSSVEDGTLFTLPPTDVSQTKTGLSAEIRAEESGEIDYEFERLISLRRINK